MCLADVANNLSSKATTRPSALRAQRMVFAQLLYFKSLMGFKLIDWLTLLQGKASADHTTLLLNCYTKLKDVDKLDQFLRGSGAADTTPSLNFDVETAVKVFSHAFIHPFICHVCMFPKDHVHSSLSS